MVERGVGKETIKEIRSDQGDGGPCAGSDVEDKRQGHAQPGS